MSGVLSFLELTFFLAKPVIAQNAAASKPTTAVNDAWGASKGITGGTEFLVGDCRLLHLLRQATLIRDSYKKTKKEKTCIIVILRRRNV